MYTPGVLKLFQFVDELTSPCFPNAPISFKLQDTSTLPFTLFFVLPIVIPLAVPQFDVVILAEPLNDVPFIVLAVCNFVAVAEFPEHEADVPPLAAAVTVILALPSKETPLIVLAVCNFVAVDAFPDNEPENVGAVTLPLTVISPLL